MKQAYYTILLRVIKLATTLLSMLFSSETILLFSQ